MNFDGLSANTMQLENTVLFEITMLLEAGRSYFFPSARLD